MIRIYLALAALAIFAFAIWDYGALRNRILLLRGAFNTANRTIEAQDSVLVGSEKIQAKERELTDEINNAPESHDAPTAPVLRDAINRLHAKPKN